MQGGSAVEIVLIFVENCFEICFFYVDGKIFFYPFLSELSSDWKEVGELFFTTNFPPFLSCLVFWPIETRFYQCMVPIGNF